MLFMNILALTDIQKVAYDLSMKLNITCNLTRNHLHFEMHFKINAFLFR